MASANSPWHASFFISNLSPSERLEPHGTQSAAHSLRGCLCFPAPHPQGQPAMRLLPGHPGTGTPHRLFIPSHCSSIGPRKERTSSSPEWPHLMPQSRRRKSGMTQKYGQSQRPSTGPAAQGTLLPHQVNPLCRPALQSTQSSLTLHGKYWSSRRPIPRHPRMFLPHTNSSPLSAKKEKRWLGWDRTKGKSPRRIMRIGFPVPGTNRAQ